MNDSADILARLRRDLAAAADPATLASGPRFFKEPVRPYGVKTARVLAIAREYLKDLQGLDKRAVFALCDHLWASGWLEESFIACDWAYARRAEFEPGDLDVFERWLGEHVSNWASCDTLCNHAIGTLLEAFPALLPRLKDWCASPSRWLRRGRRAHYPRPPRAVPFGDPGDRRPAAGGRRRPGAQGLRLAAQSRLRGGPRGGVRLCYG